MYSICRQKTKIWAEVIRKHLNKWRDKMLGKMEGRKRRRRQRIWWLDCIIDSMDMSLSKLLEIVKNREAWHAAVHGVPKSWIELSNCRTTFCIHRLEDSILLKCQCFWTSFNIIQYRFITTQIKIPANSFVDIDNSQFSIKWQRS